MSKRKDPIIFKNPFQILRIERQNKGLEDNDIDDVVIIIQATTLPRGVKSRISL